MNDKYLCCIGNDSILPNYPNRIRLDTVHELSLFNTINGDLCQSVVIGTLGAILTWPGKLKGGDESTSPMTPSNWDIVRSSLGETPGP